VDKNIETLATALYVKIDDLLLAEPDLAPWRPEGSMMPAVSDAEVLAMAVMSALLGFRSERRWLRYAGTRLTGLFPRQIGQSGYNKRLRKMIFLLMAVIRRLGMDTTLWTDDVWVVDSTPVQCGCSRETVKRSDVAGWAQYGYCASHSRYFWGLRLHLVCTLHGLPVMFAIAGAKADERETLLAMMEIDAALVSARPGQTLIGDKNYFGRDFERAVADSNLALLRPVRKGEAPRRERSCSGRCARSSSLSTRPSRPSLTWKDTADEPKTASSPASFTACSPSPRPSGTTTRPATTSNAPSSPMTTDSNHTTRNQSSSKPVNPARHADDPPRGRADPGQSRPNHIAPARRMRPRYKRSWSWLEPGPIGSRNGSQSPFDKFELIR
jgi:Transposase DDE domain